MGVAMMKFIVFTLAITAISAEFLDESGLVDDEFSIDEFLETDSEMELPCTPKPCVPICRTVTKYMTYGSFKLPYQENVCEPDKKCLAAAAACMKTLQAAMVDADKKSKALEAASKAKNAAHATKAAKDKAAAAKKAEAAAAAKSLGLAKAAFVAAEKDAANAKAAKESAAKLYTAKAAVMDARLKSYEKAQQTHKNAVAAYDGAKSAAAKAAAAYAAAVKAHCDAEAQHAAAVKHIGHGHLAQKNCAKYSTPTTVSGTCKSGWPVGLRHSHKHHVRVRNIKSLKACQDLVRSKGVATPALAWSKNHNICDYWPNIGLSKGSPNQKSCCSYWTTCYGNGKSVGEEL